MKPGMICFSEQRKKPLELHTFHGTETMRQGFNLRAGKTIQEDFEYGE